MRDDHDRPTEQHPDSHPGREINGDPGTCGPVTDPDGNRGGGGGLLVPTGPGIPDPAPDRVPAGARDGEWNDGPHSGPDSDPDGGPGSGSGGDSGGRDVGVLETAERAAEWLTRGPSPLRVPAVPGMPSGIGLRAMAVQMRSGRLTDSELQAVWAEIISRAQTETLSTGRGSTWTVAAAGLAVPELASITSRVARTYPGPLSDLEAAALAGYVAELHRVTPLPGLLRTGAHGVPRLLLHAAESACSRLADTLAPAAWITDGPHRTGRARRTAPPATAAPTDRPDTCGPDTSGPDGAPDETAAPPRSTPPTTPRDAARSTRAAGAHIPPRGDTASPRRGDGPAAHGRPAGPCGGIR